MKKYLPLLFMLLVVPGAFAAGGPRASCEEDSCRLVAAGTAPLTLSVKAGEALRFQIEEERMAGELYRAWGKQWSLPPFEHIPQAEARHEAALKQLADRAGMPVPSVQPGRFESAEIQRRYDALLVQGMASLPDALRTGALVEEQDIADLRLLMATTDNPDLRTVATALAQASGHHLKAFVSQLSRRDGAAYQAQVLPADEVVALTKDAAAGCGRGCGRAGGTRSGRS